MAAPKRLPELIKAAFAKAHSEGDLHYFPTHVQDMRVGTLSVGSSSFSSPSTSDQPGRPDVL